MQHRYHLLYWCIKHGTETGGEETQRKGSKHNLEVDSMRQPLHGPVHQQNAEGLPDDWRVVLGESDTRSALHPAISFKPGSVYEVIVTACKASKVF